MVDLLGCIERGRTEPRWQWWRPKGAEEYAHLYPANYWARPIAPADCGVDETFTQTTEWEYEERWKCPRCVHLTTGDDPMAKLHEQAQRMERY